MTMSLFRPRPLLLALGLIAFLSPTLFAADPVLIPPANFPAARTPPMGVNLEAVTDYARSAMFVDTIKSGRKFGSANTPWDESAPVDAHGWPTGDAGLVVMADVPVAPGDYLFSCSGTCEPGLINTQGEVKKLAYDKASNTTTATITITGGTNLFLTFHKTDGGVRNIRLLRPGYPLNTTQVFTNEFLAAIRPFSTLRLMDFTRTNDTDVSDWKDRPTPEDALQSSLHGAAWEYGILLANQAKKDLWINVPDKAGDDYVRQLAQLFKKNLDKDRVVYVEYSNEVWNGGFKQSARNFDAAKAEVAAGDATLTDDGKDQNQYYWAWKRVSQRLLQISAIFKEAFGAEAMNTRIRPVLASQSANSFMTRLQLEYIENHFGPPSQFIYGIAGAPYLGPDDKVANGDSPSVDDLLKATNPNGWAREATMQYLVLARYYRLHHLCYEGGLAVEGDKNLDAKVKWNKDPRLTQIVDEYFDMWYGQGGELFMYYNLASPWGRYGSWGLTDDIHVSAGKYKAVSALLAAPAPPVTAGMAVPGVVKAVDYSANLGGNIETGSDGQKHIAYVGEGNLFDYLLNVKSAGTYAISVETQGDPASKIEVLVSGTRLGFVSPGPTTGQSWSTSEPFMVKLEPGQLVLRLKVIQRGLNILAIHFDKKS